MRLSELKLVPHDSLPLTPPREVVAGGVYALLAASAVALLMHGAAVLLRGVPAGGWVAGWPDPGWAGMALHVASQIVEVFLYANIAAAALAALYLAWTLGGRRRVREALHWLVLPATLVGGGSAALLLILTLALFLVCLAALFLLAVLLALPVFLFLAFRG